jgi:hypothetical protein
LIVRLLILIPFWYGVSFATMAQQPPVKFPLGDTSRPAADTSRPVRDSAQHAMDTIKPPSSDSSLKTNPGSFYPVPDSIRHMTDSFRVNPDSLKHILDSLRFSPGSNRPAPGFQSPSQPSAGFPGMAPGMSGGMGGHSPGGAVQTTGKRPAAHAGPIAPHSNLHRRIIPVRAGPIPIDSLSVVPGTFMVKDVGDSSFTLDWVNATITWKKPPPDKDSVLITYRTFPYKFNAVARRFNYDSISNYFLVQPNALRSGYGQRDDDFFNFGNITYNGSFGRSITFGNNQDAVVTSNLNLQISGYLADSIQISAAITDNNIPIQPDGTTADLNEFDKIFLQFSKKNWALSMGDIDLRQNRDYFLTFYKRLQGASFETTNELAKGITNKTLVSAAIAKGKFTRNIFQGLEGNQGPYKLQGANNEIYFIVLAGSEKIFIDGQLMQRGEDQDYTINYNTAEVTFTARRMITQDARIQVEFEYADRNYLNVNLYLSDEVNFNNKLKLRVGLFSNSDSRNSPINQTLTPDQNKFLSRLGDSISHAYYPVSTPDTFATGKILYQKIDTTYKNAAGAIVHDSVYVFATAPAALLYNLSFANVGVGYGNYIPDLNGVNGNVYIWVAPVNGQMQGSYDAAQFLVTPKTQTIVTVGADYAVNKNTTVNVDLAKSHYDINTLSSIDKSNDDGYAAKFQLKNAQHIGASGKGLLLSSNLGYEYVQANFNPLEVLRTVEFTRNWGLTLSVNPATEKIYTGGLQLSDKKMNFIRYDIARYERSDGFTGMRHIISQKQDILGWHINDQITYTNLDSVNFKGYYLHPSLDVYKSFSWLKNYSIGGNVALERNEDRDKKADTVGAASYSYHTIQAYLKSPEKNPNRWGMTFTTRLNSYPDLKRLAEGDRSKTLNVFAIITANPHHQFRINATYRNLDIINSRITTQTSDNSLLGRVEYLVNEWKGLLRGNALYEVGSGQEQKKSYTYLLVPAGTGQYTWIDYNHDGIQQLNEFVPAQFQDQANYIRVFTPTDEYVKANYNTFNYSFTINPKMLPKGKSAAHKLLERMMLQTSMQLNQKVQAQGFIQLNPFKTPLDDTSLISRSMIVVNTFSFNRTDPHWGFDLSNTRNGAKTLLTYGYESRQANEWALRTRLNVTKSVALNAVWRQGTNQFTNSSSNFDSSNYSLQQYSLEPNITYTKGSNFRVGFGYKMSYKTNTPALGGQKYNSGGFNSDLKYNILQTTSVQARFSISTINYTLPGGKVAGTSPVDYTMLEGLSAGKNYLWGLDFTRRLGSSLELGIQYEGRKAGETNVVHTGRASLRALL